MTDGRFTQLHLLMSYPSSNPNRDDFGQPKTAIFGGTQRSRMSSQTLKRSWRTSDTWKKDSLKIGTRTRELFLTRDSEGNFSLYEQLLAKFGDKKAEEYAKAILEMFAEVEGVKDKKEVAIDEKFIGKKIVTKQPIHFSDQEIENIKNLVLNLQEEPTESELEALLDPAPRSIDLAMFGRMIARRPDRNTECAVQVSHAISINEVSIEDDFFTAVDDLNRHGSAHMNEQQFVSALYYLYLCIDMEQLKNNLGNDEKLIQRALRALVKSAATVCPSGKQNSYANNVHAFYILAEKGDYQPRNLSLAFIKAMPADEPEKAIEKLNEVRVKFNEKYGATPNHKEMNLFGRGTLKDILDFVGGPDE